VINLLGENARYDVELAEDWDKIVSKIPFLKFDFECDVKIIPPFRGAIARMIVRRGDVDVSVYLDWFDRLGGVGEPYWEIYPNLHDETERFLLNETEDMIDAIKLSLEGGSREA
jgi:hypothetical protein